jgi:hypothetical protein
VSTRILVASLAVLAGSAAPAFAFHPHGGSTHFWGLTWGSTPSGGRVGPNAAPSAVYPSAVYPSAVFPSAVFPSAVFPSAVFPSAVFPSAVYPSAVFPSAATPSAAEAQALLNWMNLVRGGCQIIGGTGGAGGASSQDINKLNASILSLKVELAEIKAELIQIRKGSKDDPPKAKGKDSMKGADNDGDQSRAPRASAPTYAAIQQDRSQITTAQAQIEAKQKEIDALRAAAIARRNATGTGTAVATNR